MDLRIDSGAVRRAGDEVADLAAEVQRATARAEEALEAAATGAGPGRLRSAMRDLLTTWRDVDPRLTRGLTTFAEELSAAASAIERVDARLAADVPDGRVAVPR